MALGPAVRYHANQMHRFAVVLALLATPVACKKEDGGARSSGTESQKPDETAKQPGVAPRSAKLPDIHPKTTREMAQRKSDLPPEANPPGVPVLSGTLEVDRDVRYIDEKVGTGPSPVKGKPVKVHYSGWLTDGKKFDASVDRGEPIEFPFDGGMVIKGWDIGLASMKAGGKRRIIIPAELAYGDRGAGDAIPAGAMLVFDLELLEAAQ